MKAFLMLLLIPAFSMAFDIKTEKNGEKLDVRIFNVPLPVEDLKKDLKSGLSTVLVANISLWQNEKLIAKSNLTFKIYYDLWDELYHRQRFSDGKEISHEKFKPNEIMDSLQKINFSSVVSLEKLKGKEISISFAVVIDPISKEKRVKIRKWLALNNVSTPGALSKASESKPNVNLAISNGSGSIQRGLFSQILDSEFEDQIDSGKWSYFSAKVILAKKDYEHEK